MMGFRRNDRRSFRREVKSLAFERAGGHCQKCPAPLLVGNYEYDHVIPWELCRDSSLTNCEVLCCPCHANKSRLDAAILAKSDRQRDKHRGAMKRIAEQMSRAENVVAVQGKQAIEWLANLIRRLGTPER